MAYKNVQYEAGKFKTGSGGGGGAVEDVTLDGVSVVNQQGVAELTSPTIPVTDVEVNGTSVVNAQGVAEIPAIPDAVVANPQGTASTALTKLQVGNDIYSVGGGSTHIYSTTEQVVGTWIDNKPVYEKTVEFGAIAANSYNYLIDLSLTTVNKVIDICCIAYNGNSFFKLPLALNSLQSEYGIAQQAFDKSTGKLRIDTGSYRSITGGYVIIRYTKTTD